VSRRPPRIGLLALSIATIASAASAAELPPGPNPTAGIRDLVEQAKPCVVGVDAFQTVPKGLWVHTRDFLNPFPLRSFIGDALVLAFYLPRAALYPFPSHRLASGFIVDTDGHIATSQHLVADYNRFSVRFCDGTALPATLAAQDDLADLALLKVDAAAIPPPARPARLADSDAVRAGDWVMVMGSPLGLDYTVTTGIVSAVARRIDVTYLDDLIQIDAALDPGNSGGPVFDAAGRVIGISEASIFLAQNKGFAVPSNMFASALPNLKAGTAPRRGLLGVIIENPTSKDAAARGLAQPAGALVVGVEKASGAQAAGIRPGDLIIRYQQAQIGQAVELMRAARRTPPGEVVEVELLRPSPATRAGEQPFRETLKVRVGLITKPFEIF